MPKFRSVNPSLWAHPFFARQPWFVRDLFLYLVTAAADDEGRFKADPVILLTGAFPRRYPVEEEDITQALEALADGGLVCLYGEGNRYGFLTGWYEHQRIDKRWRDESSLPPPPVAPASWEAVDGIYTAYCEARGIAGKTSYRNAMAWYQAGCPAIHETPTEDPEENHARITRESLDNLAPDVDVDVDPDLEHPSAPVATATSAQNSPASQEPQSDAARKRAERQQREETVRLEISELRSQFEPADLVAVDEFLDMVSGHRANGRLTPAGERAFIRKLLAARNDNGMTSERWAYGIAQAVRANADNVNYVLKAARNPRAAGDADFAGGRRPGTQRRLTPEDEAILRDEQRAREARRNGAP
ncbi:MAG: hypothetical protein PHZ19_03955 [Candidatus Thermoplasmatota archaeon]|nr:hypothetical protein [Candidatus Thermoplasmatota archaeon]